MVNLLGESCLENTLFEKNHPVAQELIASLNLECRHQREYLRLIEEEKQALQSLKTYNIQECSARREAVICDIKKEQENRIRLLKGMLKKITTNRPELRITAIAERVFHPDDSRKVNEICSILKDLITLTKRKTHELESIVSFSMNLISGSLSVILSQSQVQTPLYNAIGKVAQASKSNVSGNRQMSRLA